MSIQHAEANWLQRIVVFLAYLTFELTTIFFFFLMIKHCFSSVQTGTCTWQRPMVCARRWQWGSCCQTLLVQKICSWSKRPSHHDVKRVGQRWMCFYTGQHLFYLVKPYNYIYLLYMVFVKQSGCTWTVYFIQRQRETDIMCLIKQEVYDCVSQCE